MGYSNFKLPNPNLPPAPALPSSVLSRILHFAQLHQPLPAQQAIRFRFELVNKAWFQSSFRYKTISLTSLSSTSKVLRVLMGLARAGQKRKGKGGAGLSGDFQTTEEVALRIERVHLHIAGVKGAEETMPLIVLLKKVLNVEELLLEVDEQSFGEGCVGGVLLNLLSELKRIKSFTMSRAKGKSMVPPTVSTSFWSKLIPSWPKLESLTIEDCSTVHSDSVCDIFRNSFALHSVTLKERGEGIFTLLDLVPELPASVRVLDIDSAVLYTFPAGLRSLVLDPKSWAVARQLTSCTLTDDPDTTAFPSEEPRGQLETFVLNLHNVEELIISPCAIEELGALTSLKQLNYLQVVRGSAAHEENVETMVRMSEIFDLWRGAKKIKTIAVDRRFARYWGAKEMKTILRLVEPEVAFVLA